MLVSFAAVIRVVTRHATLLPSVSLWANNTGNVKLLVYEMVMITINMNFMRTLNWPNGLSSTTVFLAYFATAFIIIDSQFYWCNKVIPNLSHQTSQSPCIVSFSPPQAFLFSRVWLNLRIYLAALRDRSISENNGDRTPRYKTDLHFVNGAGGQSKVGY